MNKIHCNNNALMTQSPITDPGVWLKKKACCPPSSPEINSFEEGGNTSSQRLTPENDDNEEKIKLSSAKDPASYTRVHDLFHHQIPTDGHRYYSEHYLEMSTVGHSCSCHQCNNSYYFSYVSPEMGQNQSTSLFHQGLISSDLQIQMNHQMYENARCERTDAGFDNRIPQQYNNTEPEFQQQMALNMCNSQSFGYSMNVCGQIDSSNSPVERAFNQNYSDDSGVVLQYPNDYNCFSHEYEEFENSSNSHEKIDLDIENNNQLSHPNSSNGPIQLWQFLLDLLNDPTKLKYICWTGNGTEFKLIDPDEIARLWGLKKNRPKMTYEKMSRGLRYYYEKKIIEKAPGKRYVYRFMNRLNEVIRKHCPPAGNRTTSTPDRNHNYEEINKAVNAYHRKLDPVFPEKF